MRNEEGNDGSIGASRAKRRPRNSGAAIIPAPSWAQLKMIFLRQTKI
jgi:hypothetical protein